MQQEAVGDPKSGAESCSGGVSVVGRRTRRGAALAAAGLTAALVTTAAGCSTTAIGSPTPAAKSGTPVTTATASDGASGAAAGAGSGSVGVSGGSGSGSGTGGSGSGSAGTPECTASVLNISAATGPSGAGHQSEVLHFSNAGSHTCFVRGSPGVAQLGVSSQTLQNAVRTFSGYLGGLPSGQSVPTVVLAPGRSASALVEALDAATNGSTACVGADATGLLVTAPDQTSSVQVPSLLKACADFQVHPIVAASSGSGASGGSQNTAGLEVDIRPEGGITLTPGGPAATFTVLLHNTASTDWAQVGLVVSFGHCSCTTSTLFPSGKLTVDDPRFSGTQSAPYDAEGFGTDFLNETAVPAIAITAGTTDIFTFHVQLNASQAANVSSGKANVDVTLTDAANNQQVSPSPFAALPISIS